MNTTKTELASRRIKKYISKMHYDYTVEDVISIYLRYWVDGWYVGYTANDVISKYLIELRALTGIYTNRK